MPRRRKPLGYEKWTWAEIQAGRRMTKEEKRWRRMSKKVGLGREALAASQVVTAPATPARTRVRAPALPSLPELARLTDSVARFFSFQWVHHLPDWLQPIVWSLIVTSALALALFRWYRETPWAADVVICVAFVAAGTALGGLIHDGLRLRRRRRAQEEAERAEMRERFRKILARELTTRPMRDFDFAALVEEHAIPRFEADAAAALVYRHFADRVVEDGVITTDERRRLETLARLLEIGPERVTLIESAAKSNRFQAALDDLLADGVVSDFDVKQLEFIRWSLGVDEADWTIGRKRIFAARFEGSFGEGVSDRG
jgi:hypothetical protein